MVGGYEKGALLMWMVQRWMRRAVFRYHWSRCCTINYYPFSDKCYEERNSRLEVGGYFATIYMFHTDMM